jgi:Pectate lyase superfamily protein
VAIVQISRITQRKGLTSDLPSPLAGAELGWATDERRLFIGNGTLADGAPVVGNTEILTEYSDILGFATAYTYQGTAGGYVVQTGATAGSPVSQSLQSRLDSYAVITDFGATGDGVTDVTANINRALSQIYCQGVTPQVRRGLYLPAGVYLISDTIAIPSYAYLYGDGAQSTIIRFAVAAWTNTIPYGAGILVSSAGLYYRSQLAVPIGTGLTDSAPSGPYWVQESLPEYVVRTADSLQQTGADIATNGAIPPQYISVHSMAFETQVYGNDSSVSHNVCLIDRAEYMSFDQVSFSGPFTTADGDTSTQLLNCVNFNSSASLICSQINFDQCVFAGASYGINTDEQIQSCTISASKFDTLYRGIVLGSGSPVNGGPVGVRMVENLFDNIYSQGIVIDSVSLNLSAYNMFLDVANHYLGNDYAYAPVIDINTTNNVSIGDMFQRTTAQTLRNGTYYPRIELTNTSSVTLGMNNTLAVQYTINNVANTKIANQLGLGTYVREAGVNNVITDNATRTMFTVDTTAVQAFQMAYTMLRGTAVRTGILTVVRGKSDASGGFSFADNYQENASTGVTLTAAEATAGGNVTVSITATSTGTSGTINYSVSYLA